MLALRPAVEALFIGAPCAFHAHHPTESHRAARRRSILHHHLRPRARKPRSARFARTPFLAYWRGITFADNVVSDALTARAPGRQYEAGQFSAGGCAGPG